MRRYTVPLLTLVALLLIIAASFFFLRDTSPYAEAKTIGTGSPDFQELSDRFQALARAKGGVYAFDVLKRAVLPPNIDVHLLGHVVGDELYKQKGVNGIAFCTQDFRNACSHAIVIGTLNEFGSQKALSLIHEACTKAPGGSGAYTMCFHGLGHGVFSYYQYNLPQAIAFCKKTGTPQYHNLEYVECVGGIIMELIDGGGHDHSAWVDSRSKYLDPKDPLAPCSTALVPRDVKGICYTYLTPYLFEAAGGNLANPQPADFAGAFKFCNKISTSTPDLRRDCFAGIGKEFPVLALSRDVRSVDQAGDAALQQMRAWCKLAPIEEAYNDCVRSIVSSLYWGGENDPHGVVKFCNLADGADRDRCFSGIFEEAGRYPSLQLPGVKLCTIMPDDKTAECHSKLK